MDFNWGSVKQYFLVFLSLICTNYRLIVNGAPRVHVPCFFIYGDSLVDSGNNNDLSTAAKVNYSPYGIDFPNGPTGRFCNGRTTADIIGELLGFDGFIPPFPTASGLEVLRGVNYGSGSAGILYETGRQLGDNTCLGQQLKNHLVTISRIVDLQGSIDTATKYLNQCLYLIVTGSNDYINNYFMPQNYNTSFLYTPEQYAQVLIEEYSKQVLTLYNYGARKVALNAIGAIGCTPYAMAHYGTAGSVCVDNMNQAVNLFNDRLISLVNQLNANLTDAKFLYLNTLGVVPPATPLPGIEVRINGCCKVDEIGQCTPNEDPCPIRRVYMFWDGFHPTEVVNRITAQAAYLQLQKIL